MAARGGKRPNAGRPRGSQTKRTQELVAKVAAEGISPVEYMLQCMRGQVDVDKDKLSAAIAAAPYIHPKLSSVEANIKTMKHDIDDYSDEELAAIAAAGRECDAETPDGTEKPH